MSGSPAPPDESAPTTGYDETAAPVAGKSSNDVVHDEKRDSLEAALPSELVSAGSQHLQRRLGGKEVQLIALGGAIGTCKTSFLDTSPAVSDGYARHHF
jgi:amino acid permease